jgi:crotonobetainyl-CoA:carnitine CoA-transferase CaiB-like acyl-CoA transferase
MADRFLEAVGVLDLSGGGADAVTRLVAEADAVFFNFKPGTLIRLGFPTTRCMPSIRA